MSEITAAAIELPPFIPFPSISRLSREVIVTEKVDGTNAQVYITEDGKMYAGSRTRWINPLADNFGFAAWVQANRDELMRLGPGSHFGEWYGAGIQRNYGLTDKRFALFNVTRWEDDAVRPACCGVVPVLHRGTFNTGDIDGILEELQRDGSRLVPGFMDPEGIVVYHEASKTLYKRTLDGDGHKGSKPRSRRG